MRLATKVLNEETLECYKEEFAGRSKSDTWYSSAFTWNQNLRSGFPGAILQSSVSKELFDRVVQCTRDRLPPYKTIHIQHYIWQPYSGITIHRDEPYYYSATIYLNEVWAPEFGGLFVWRDSPKDMKWNAICPTYNTMIINKSGTEHMVTMVSPYSYYPRISLQLRLFDKEI
jgi:hypothetical protein